MPWNSGTFTRSNGVNTGSTVWNQDAAQGTKIVTSRHDTHDQDLASGINSCLLKDGSNASSSFAIKAGIPPGTIYNNGANPSAIDWSRGFMQYLSLNTAIGPLSFSNVIAGVQYTLFANNTDSSNHSVSIPSAVSSLAGITVNANTIAQINIIKVGNYLSVFSVVMLTNAGFAGP